MNQIVFDGEYLIAPGLFGQSNYGINVTQHYGRGLIAGESYPELQGQGEHILDLVFTSDESSKIVEMAIRVSRYMRYNSFVRSSYKSICMEC